MQHPIKLAVTALNNLSVVVKQKNGSVFKPIAYKLNRMYYYLQISLTQDCGLDYWQELLHQATETLEATKGIVVYVYSTSGMTNLIIENLSYLKAYIEDIISLGTQSGCDTAEPSDLEEEPNDYYQTRYQNPRNAGQPEVQLEDYEYELSQNYERIKQPTKAVAAETDFSALQRIYALEQQNDSLAYAVCLLDYKCKKLEQRQLEFETQNDAQLRYIDEFKAEIEQLRQDGELKELRSQVYEILYLLYKTRQQEVFPATQQSQPRRYTYQQLSAPSAMQASSSFFKYPSFAYPSFGENASYAYQQAQRNLYKPMDRRSTSAGRYANRLQTPPNFEQQMEFK